MSRRFFYTQLIKIYRTYGGLKTLSITNWFDLKKDPVMDILMLKNKNYSKFAYVPLIVYNEKYIECLKNKIKHKIGEHDFEIVRFKNLKDLNYYNVDKYFNFEPLLPLNSYDYDHISKIIELAHFEKQFVRHQPGCTFFEHVRGLQHKLSNFEYFDDFKNKYYYFNIASVDQRVCLLEGTLEEYRSLKKYIDHHKYKEYIELITKFDGLVKFKTSSIEIDSYIKNINSFIFMFNNESDWIIKNLHLDCIFNSVIRGWLYITRM